MKVKNRINLKRCFPKTKLLKKLISKLREAFRKELFIRILEYGENNPKGFSYEEIVSDLRLRRRHEFFIVDSYIYNAFNNSLRTKRGSSQLETPFFLLKNGKKKRERGDGKGMENKYIINLSSRFKYLEFKELKEASLTARRSRFLSLIAILIAFLTLYWSVLDSTKVPFSSVVIHRVQAEEIFSALRSIERNKDVQKEILSEIRNFKQKENLE